MTNKLLVIKIKIMRRYAPINLYKKLQNGTKNIGYKSWSEVIADLTKP